MASLGTLPVELLHVIAQFVSTSPIRGNEDTGHQEATTLPEHDLAALARTNRRLHQIFDQLLYQWDRDHLSYALGWAVIKSSYQTLEKALSFGYDINHEVCYLAVARNRGLPSEHLRPLEVAVAEENIGALKWLLEHGAKPDFGVVEDLELEGSGKIQRLTSAGTSALFLGLEDAPNEEAALILLDHGARVHFAYESLNPTEDRPLECNNTALHLAARQGMSIVVERLLIQGEIDIESTDEDHFTALHHAVSIDSPRTTIIEMLVRHGADPNTESEGRTRAIQRAIEEGHIENVLALIQAMADRCSSNAAPQPWSHLFLYLIVDGLSSRLENHEPAEGLSDEAEVRMILAKLIELGADFNNPPPRFYKPESYEPLLSWATKVTDDVELAAIIFKTLVDLGADPFIKMEDGQPLCYANCVEWLYTDSLPCKDVLELLLRAGTRMDHHIPSAEKTLFELAVDFCDERYHADPEGLEFLLTRASPKTLAASHVYEILDSRFQDIQNHLNGCLLIMQHGWISSKARTYMFEWLVSYITGIPVRRSGLYLDKANKEFNKNAAKYFPGLLNREQLDQLWEKGCASYCFGLEGPYGRVKCPESKWVKLPWMHINAERGDVEAMKLLLDWKFPAFNFEEDDEEDEMVTNGYNIHSPLMRAMHRGHRTAALSLIEHVAKTWKSQRGFLNCGHWDSFNGDMNNCSGCPYGQKSACDLAFSLGEVNLLEHMWDDLLALEQAFEQRVQWEARQLYMPRVYSHGNVFAEWIELKLGMCNWMALKARGQDASWFRLEIGKRLAKLRSEVEEIRDAWRARAKSCEREKGDALPRAWEVEDGTEHS